ncbi:amidase [Actibacterium sp. 188UL27-1]|uniref:amidase n=1 Tax=Actibacterium sp. 188UL27-1 TaxID=2786961 RepID=UPI001957310C|nr:amidase [Actibacterium sp. 188UL27-1]MBM7067511.1 amidase [Actibacterium sp. 188UL27-1]
MTGPARRRMEATLTRIDTCNDTINAIVSLRDPDTLLADADRADRSDLIGPLHGIPMAVKDLVATAGIRTTLGSPIFATHVPSADDAVARRLRQAGAILIGKTNTPEFGLGSHSYNPVHGVTRNPYDTRLTAGGSSGGAAAALACGMVDLADGSDMMGSLRNPAGWCNIYGFRPSWGLVPADAVGDSYLHMLATDGPMARSPAGLARLLQVLAEPEPLRPFGRKPEDFTAALAHPARRSRIGWLNDWDGAYPMEPGILDLCRDALAIFDTPVERMLAPFDAARLWTSWTTLRAFSVAAKLEPLYADPIKRAQLKPEAIWEVERGLALSAMDLQRASLDRSDWFRTAMTLFGQFDFLALPTAQVWPFPADWHWPKSIDGTEMNTYHRWMEVVIPVSLIGLPCIAVPAGFGPAGLPMGVQLFGPPGSDVALLQLAQHYHERTDWTGQRPPILWG